MADSHDELQGLMHQRRTGTLGFYRMRVLSSGEYRVVGDGWDRRRTDRRRAHRTSADRRQGH